jgi:hypothetical protein
MQEGKGAKRETLDEGLAVWIGKLHVKAKNGVVTSGVIKENAKTISKYCTPLWH